MPRYLALSASLALTVMLLAAMLGPVLPALAISHPNAYVYGIVAKAVKTGVSVWWWQDDNGIDHYLPFKPQARDNYTIEVWKMELAEDQFPNASIKFSGSASDSYSKLTYDHGIVYYIKNVLDDQTRSMEYTYINFDIDVPVESTTRIFFVAKKNTIDGSGLVGVNIMAISAGQTYMINIWLGTYNNIVFSSSTNGLAVVYEVPDGGEDRFIALLTAPIEELLAKGTGSNIDIDYIDDINIQVRVDNSTASESEAVEGWFKFCIITDVSEIKVNDVVVNATDLVYVPTSSGEALNIYGLKVDSIYDVQIPFIYETEPDIATYADTLKMAYTWQFQVPDDPNAGTFSGLGLNFTLNKDAGYYDYLYLNGEDKLSVIADHKAGDTVTIATGLTAGTVYVLQTRVRYTADEYDALTAAPVFWVNPVGWLAYNWWAVCAFIASIFGLVGLAKKARARARKYRIPRR